MTALRFDARTGLPSLLILLALAGAQPQPPQSLAHHHSAAQTQTLLAPLVEPAAIGGCQHGAADPSQRSGPAFGVPEGASSVAHGAASLHTSPRPRRGRLHRGQPRAPRGPPPAHASFAFPVR